MTSSAGRCVRNYCAATLTLVILTTGCGAEKARQEAAKARMAEQAAVHQLAENEAKRKAEVEAKTEAIKGPKFESELQISHTVAGGTATSSHKSTRYTGGTPFSAVEDYSSTFRGDKATVKFRVKFLKHENGEDVFDVESTIEKPSGSESKTTTAAYKGEKKTILENEFTKIILQPPSK
jgi:hypothetical protein